MNKGSKTWRYGDRYITVHADGRFGLDFDGVYDLIPWDGVVGRDAKKDTITALKEMIEFLEYKEPLPETGVIRIFETVNDGVLDKPVLAVRVHKEGGSWTAVLGALFKGDITINTRYIFDSKIIRWEEVK